LRVVGRDGNIHTVVNASGKTVRGEAFLQALEIGPGKGGRGAKTVSVPAP
jgi:hypothetical protein